MLDRPLVSDPGRVLPQVQLEAFPALLPLVLVSLYLMFAPVWAPTLTSLLYDDARIFQLGLLAAVAALLLHPQVRAGAYASWCRIGHAAQRLLAVLVAGGLVSALFSAAPKLALLELALVVQLVALVVMVSAMVRMHGASADAALAVAAMTGAGLVGLQFWLALGISVLESRPFSWAHPFLEFANVRFFGQYQSYVLMLLPLPLVLFHVRGWRKLLFCIAGANFWALQWMVGGRSVWVAFGIAAVSLWVLSPRARTTLLRVQLAMILGGFLIFAAYSGATRTADDVTAIPRKLSVTERGSNSIHERVEMLRVTTAAVAERPLTGVGPGQFGLLDYPIRGAHPHSAPLQLLAEYGLVAGGAACALGFALVMLAIRTLRRRSDPYREVVDAAIAASLLMGLTESLFSGGIIMPHAQILLCVVAGWLLARHTPLSGTVAPRSSLLRSGPILAAAVFVAVSVSCLLVMQYRSVVWDMPISAQRWHPHFWQYGRFDAW